MADYLELDFHAVETKKSGDAISIRYVVNGIQYIHVVDGGYMETGERLVQNINSYYGNPGFLDHVVATHPDHDHSAGLRAVLENFEVGTLWMNRPWLYAAELLPRFPTYTSSERLASRFRSVYPNLAALEEIAVRRGIRIEAPFQGSMIGYFTVLAPTRSRFLDCVVNSKRTPEGEARAVKGLFEQAFDQLAKAVAYIRTGWGEEVFSPEEAGAENEMSVVQYAYLSGSKVMLTGDAGRDGMSEAIAFAPRIGLALPGIDKFQVPHHGSRRNLSTEILDALLGPRLPSKPIEKTWTAIISSAKEDEDHPRNAVVRAMAHRGATVLATEGKAICTYAGAAPSRGWVAATELEYPETQET